MWIFLKLSLAADPAVAATTPASPANLGQALAARDGVGCAGLGVADSALRDGLIAHTDPTLMPPWVPVRAAGCLIELFPADPVTLSTVTPWMTDPGAAGLALVVAQQIDRFPAADAAKLAVAAMSAPEGAARDRVQRRLQKSTLPEVVVVVQPAGGAPAR